MYIYVATPLISHVVRRVAGTVTGSTVSLEIIVEVLQGLAEV